MDHRTTERRPARGTRRIVLVGAAILLTAIAIPSLQRPFAAATLPRSWADAGRSAARSPELDEDDGVIADGEAVSVFADDTPAVTRLDPDLLVALRAAATDAAADGIELRVNSGWRSPAHQQQLLQDAIVEHGSPEEAARWVATPATSAHVSGEAVDIGPLAAAAWLAGHGAAHGLCRVYGNEPWHYELRPDAVAEGCPPMYADPTEDPRMRP